MPSTLSDYEKALWDTYNNLFKVLAKASNDKGSAALASRNDIERKYGRAYQNLVRAGLAQQIRKKYRSY